MLRLLALCFVWTVSLLLFTAANGQSLVWGYGMHSPGHSFDGVLGIGSNGIDKWAILGNGNSDINLNLKGSPVVPGSKNFIAVYDAQANLLWSKTLVDALTELYYEGLLMDNLSNVYICGKFKGTIDFDPGSGVISLSTQNPNVYEFFIQKIKADGTLDWVAHATTDDYGDITHLTQTSDGTIYGAGMTAQGNQQNFLLVKISPSGVVEDSKKLPLSLWGNILGFTHDAQGNVYLSGTFDQTLDADPGPESFNLQSFRGYDGFLIKLTPELNLVWAKRMGDIGPSNMPVGWDGISQVAIDSQGTIYAGGYFTWNTDFDPDDNPGTYVIETGDNTQKPDGCIIKYSSDGKVQGIIHIGDGGNIYDDIMVLFVKIWNNQLLVGGYLSNVADVEPGSGETLIGNDVSLGSAWYGNYNLNGELLGAFSLNSIGTATMPGGYVTSGGLQIIADRNIVTAGTFERMLDLEPGSGKVLVSCDSLNPMYQFDKDIFLARYNWNPIGIIPPKTHDFTIVPNPATDFIYLPDIQEISEIEILDVWGKLVLRENFVKKRFVEIKSLQPGLYIINLNGNHTRWSSRFIKI